MDMKLCMTCRRYSYDCPGWLTLEAKGWELDCSYWSVDEEEESVWESHGFRNEKDYWEWRGGVK